MKQLERVRRDDTTNLSNKWFFKRAERAFLPPDEISDIRILRGLSPRAQRIIYSSGGKLTLEGIYDWLEGLKHQPHPSDYKDKRIDNSPDAALIKRIKRVQGCGLVTAQEIVTFCRENKLIE